jgi:hypothetical protein
LRIFGPLDEGFDLRFKDFCTRCGVAPACTAAGAELCNGEKNTVKIGWLDAPFAELVFYTSDVTAFNRP